MPSENVKLLHQNCMIGCRSLIERVILDSYKLFLDSFITAQFMDAVLSPYITNPHLIGSSSQIIIYSLWYALYASDWIKVGSWCFLKLLFIPKSLSQITLVAWVWFPLFVIWWDSLLYKPFLAEAKVRGNAISEIVKEKGDRDVLSNGF